MKNSALGIVAAAVLGGAVAIAALSWFLPKYGIIIQASNQDIDSDHWKKVEEVLKRPKKTPNSDSRDKLYRIREFDNGKLVGASDEGTLPETELLEARQETINGLPVGFTGHAFQIGVGAWERSQRIPANGTMMPQAHFRPNITESKLMVDEVNDALK